MKIALLTAILALAVASLHLKKSVASIVSFALMMFLLGLYYIALDAKLLGLFQIFVYTGGIIVLMLFGVTIIGRDFPQAKQRPWAATASLGVFVSLTFLFYKTSHELPHTVTDTTEKVTLFANSFGDMVLLFALMGSSLLYATVKMAKALSAKRRSAQGGKDV